MTFGMNTEYLLITIAIDLMLLALFMKKRLMRAKPRFLNILKKMRKNLEDYFMKRNS